MGILRNLLGLPVSNKDFDHYMNLADQGDNKGLFMVGMMYHDSKPPSKIQHLPIKERTRIGAIYLKRAADQGDMMALDMLKQFGHVR